MMTEKFLCSKIFLENYDQTNMQYANLRLNTPEHHALILKPPEIKVSSILLYQTERELVIEEEFPEYTRFDSTFNPQAPVAQKVVDDVVFRRFQGEGVSFLIGPH